MSAFLAELQRVASDFDELNIPWALAGGLACSVFVEPRTTKDIDVVVLCEDSSSIQELSQSFQKKGYTDMQLLMHMNPVYRLGFRMFVPSSKAYEIPIDFLTSSTGIEKEILSASKHIEILPSIHVPVVALGHLIAMKVVSCTGADRLQDKVDIQHLLQAANSSDMALARAALSGISVQRSIPASDLFNVLDELSQQE